ncbi:hypothetical protein ACEYYH_10395 [Microbacterium trichothecenolyticum]|uniref:hypothetical protein n=1 Tax=Microbacterium trichothecenolyticum TaxID=69370 RepID=UPI0035BE8584
MSPTIDRSTVLKWAALVGIAVATVIGMNGLFDMWQGWVIILGGIALGALVGAIVELVRLSRGSDK